MSASHISTYQPFQNCQNSLFPINVKENRRGNQKLTSQRHWQHWADETQDEDKQKTETKTKHNLDKFPNCHISRQLISAYQSCGVRACVTFYFFYSIRIKDKKTNECLSSLHGKYFCCTCRQSF